MVKFGVEALSDALARGVAARHRRHGGGAGRVPHRFSGDPSRSSNPRPGSRTTPDKAGKARAGTQAGHGNQQGDPVRGARAIIAAVESDKPPVDLPIGGDALDRLRAKLDDMRRETDTWEDGRAAPPSKPATAPDPDGRTRLAGGTPVVARRSLSLARLPSIAGSG